MLILISKVLLYLIALLYIGIFHKAYIQNGAMADTIIGIAIALHQAIVACNITRLGMAPYGTFEIHTCKEPVNSYNKQHPLVYYKPNERLVRAMKIFYPYPPTYK